MLEKPKFLQGVFAFEGKGLDTPELLDASLSYKVPYDKRAQLIYFRAGNSSAELIFVVLRRAHTPMRWFPIGAKSTVHVPLAVVEDIFPDTLLEVYVGAPASVNGHVVIDIGLIEV